MLTKLTHSNTSGRSTQYNFTYGALDLISEVSVGTDENSAKILSMYEYKTDDNSYNLSYQHYGNGDYVSYGYDEKGRLIDKIYSGTVPMAEYSYDNNGG